NGVFFVSLQALGSDQLIATTIIETLNLPFAGGNAPLEQLLDYLSDKSCLLLLDNFEHVLTGAPLITDSLQAAPNVKILVTSRERLNLLEEWVLEISGLPFPGSASETEIDQFDAVRLFMQCARRINHSFALTGTRKAAVTQICRLVGGMPLGIELAAA